MVWRVNYAVWEWGEAFGRRDRGSDSHLYTSLGRDSSGYGDVLAHGMYNGIVVHTPH